MGFWNRLEGWFLCSENSSEAAKLVGNPPGELGDQHVESCEVSIFHWSILLLYLPSPITNAKMSPPTGKLNIQRYSLISQSVLHGMCPLRCFLRKGLHGLTNSVGYSWWYQLKSVQVLQEAEDKLGGDTQGVYWRNTWRIKGKKQAQAEKEGEEKED